MVGTETGYMMSQYLRLNHDVSSVLSQQPIGTVKANGWVNLRQEPSLTSQQAGMLYNNDTITILGETNTHWYYVNANGILGYVKTDYVTMGQTTNQSSSAQGGSGTTGSTTASQNVTVNVDTEGSLDAYVTASNCAVYLVPTNETTVSCQYDASVLRFTHDIQRGTQQLTLERINTSGANDAATLYIPSDAYDQIYLHVEDGRGSIAGGFNNSFIVYGYGARFSLTFAEGNTYPYNISLMDSTCVVGIDENASNYSISVEQIDNSSIETLLYDMPPYQNGASTYSHTNGTGATQIKVPSLRNSTPTFTAVIH